MKYMVLVNQKYMVAVETEGSNAAAEHMILDNFDGIQGAQAFDKAAMRTSYFFDILQSAETISLKELGVLSDNYKAAYKRLAEKADYVRRYQDEIADLKEKLASAESMLKAAEYMYRQAKEDTEEPKRMLNWRE